MKMKQVIPTMISPASLYKQMCVLLDDVLCTD